MLLNRISMWNVVMLVSTTVATSVVAPTSLAQNFRVDTDVMLGNSEETFSEHLTLFYGSVVYDFTVKGPKEIAILNLSDGKITLLDVTRRVRADLTTAELLEFSAKIKAIGTNNQATDLVSPKFEVAFDETTQKLKLTSSKITYEATGFVPSDATVANRYREFTDWYARLNSMRPPNPPHFARLELNRELASRKLVPTKIERTVSVGKLFAKPQQARSTHSIGMTISGTDRRRIDEAAGYLVSFKTVKLAEYMQVEAVAAN